MKQLGGAADWLLRYDAMLRHRQAEQSSARPVALLLASSVDEYTDAGSGERVTETREVVEITIVHRRRALPSRFVPLFAPDLSSPPRILVRQPTRALPPVPPPIALLPAAPQPEPEVEWDLEPEASLPPPSFVLDGPTDAMALPPYAFDYEDARGLVNVTPGDAMMVASDTEPMFPRTPEASPHVIVVMVEPSAKSPSVRPAEVDLVSRGITPPPSPRLAPPILELTPPRWPISAPVMPEAVVEAGMRRSALILDELPNPWKDEAPRALVPASSAASDDRTASQPVKKRKLATRLLRAVALTALAACAGAGIRSARLHAHPNALAPPVTTTTAAVTPAAVVVAVAAAAALPSAAPAVAGPSEGEIEVVIVGKSPIHVDGMLRGNGPHLVLKIAPGYHMIRAGADRTELAEVRAGKTARVDFARAP